MNIPKEAIEKAIEGGWQPKVSNWEHTPHSYLYEYSFVLNPTFWQSLGKALGWGKGIGTGQYFYSPSGRILNDAEYQAMRFYDLILQSQPTDDFWQELLDNK